MMSKVLNGWLKRQKKNKKGRKKEKEKKLNIGGRVKLQGCQNAFKLEIINLK